MFFVLPRILNDGYMSACTRYREKQAIRLRNSTKENTMNDCLIVIDLQNDYFPGNAIRPMRPRNFTRGNHRKHGIVPCYI
jgi:hypothetical protein